MLLWIIDARSNIEVRYFSSSQWASNSKYVIGYFSISYVGWGSGDIKILCLWTSFLIGWELYLNAWSIGVEYSFVLWHRKELNWTTRWNNWKWVFIVSSWSEIMCRHIWYEKFEFKYIIQHWILLWIR